MDKNNPGNPDTYPRPSKSDEQFNNQPEYIDQQPNDFKDKSISGLPANNETERESNDPSKDLKD